MTRSELKNTMAWVIYISIVTALTLWAFSAKAQEDTEADFFAEVEPKPAPKKRTQPRAVKKAWKGKKLADGSCLCQCVAPRAGLYNKRGELVLPNPPNPYVNAR